MVNFSQNIFFLQKFFDEIGFYYAADLALFRTQTANVSYFLSFVVLRATEKFITISYFSDNNKPIKFYLGFCGDFGKYCFEGIILEKGRMKAQKN